MAINSRYWAFSLLLTFSALAGCALSGSDRSHASAEQDLDEANGWVCSGVTGHNQPADDRYYVTSFGCWIDGDGDHRGDPSDNCIPYCSGVQSAKPAYEALCPGMSGPECERHVQWFVADSDRFGCMQRLKVTNPNNGKAAVMVVLDKGPACWVERKVDHWVLDMSYPASYFLFGEPKSATERGEVIVEEVDPSTPLGPWDETGDSAVEEGEGDDGGGDSVTWEEPSCVDDGVCTQDDDCLCVDCHDDAFCSDPAECEDDGVCDAYLEGCVCADCAEHPICGSASGFVVDSHDENNDSGARCRLSSAWTSSSNVGGYVGTGYHWRSTGQTSDLARFELWRDQGQRLTVQAWWTAGSDRSPNAPFIIYDGDGDKLDTVYVDQQHDGSQWVTLGTYDFGPGWATAALSRWTGAGYVVVADAVRFVPE